MTRDPARPPAPGRLGVHLTADGADVAVVATRARSVEVVLFDPDEPHDDPHQDPGHEAVRGAQTAVVPLTRRVHGVWHGHLPGVRAGQRYGLRVDGPWEPGRGLRHNPAKLLLDPYARAVEGTLRWGPELFAHRVDDDTWAPVDGPPHEGGAAVVDDRDSADAVPRCVVVEPPVADPVERPRVPWSRTVVYEAHVRGLTMRHPQVPPQLRGTYAALGHPAVVEHLLSLGVTTLELLPVMAVGDEPALRRRGLRNYWGYSTMAFLAPEPRYASAAARRAGPQAVVAELAQAVRTLHAAGIEVLLDVVLNHTNEGGVAGPTTSLRGLDATTYYRLDQRGLDRDVTGTGGALDFGNVRVVQLALDCLRYWVTAYGVDGFRFDLAPTLARGPQGFDPDHPFLVACRTDPVLQDVKLVAEPWDVGHHGWRTGQFPPPFAEWNDVFRDDVRTFWLADAAAASHDPQFRGHGVRNLATRLAGSADFFHRSTSADGVVRGPLASVNLVTAHDGFTLADLTAYEQRRNWANGEDNRDGHGDNRSWNHGVEGPTDDAAVLASRARTRRAVLATLLLATGVPMITAGDEMGRTQLGNNNAYCLDDATTWLDWGPLPEEDGQGHPQTPGAGTDPDGPPPATSDDGIPGGSGPDEDLLATTRALLGWRRRFPVLRQDSFFAGRAVHPDGTTDLAWFGPDGEPMDHDRWHAGSRTLQMFLHGHSAQDGSVEDSLLVVLHGGAGDVPVRLPSRPWAEAFELLWDSVHDHPQHVPAARYAPGDEVAVAARTVHLYRAIRP